MQGLKELKWFLIVIIGMWVVWFFTGGSERFESKAGPFLRPPAPLSSGEIYGETLDLDINADLNLSSGIEGTLISKKCANVPAGTRCNETRPMTLRFTKENGTVIQNITLKQDGTFKISLPGGTYIISQKSYYTDVAPYQHPIVVKVKSFNYSRVGLVFDSAIR